MPSSRGSSPSRDGTWVSFISCTGRWILYHWATWKAYAIFFYLSLRFWLWSLIIIILGISLHIKLEAYADSVCPKDLKICCQLGDYPHQCHVSVLWSCPLSRTLPELGKKGKELCLWKAMVKSTNATWMQREKCEEWSFCLWLGEAQKCRAVIGVSDGVEKEKARGLWWPPGHLCRLTLRRMFLVLCSVRRQWNISL